MDDRELRKRIQTRDPSSGVEVRSPDEQSSRRMLEGIMEESTTVGQSQIGRYIFGAAAVIVLVLGGLALFGGPAATPDVATVQLSLGESNTLASCLQPSAEILGDMPLAFAGSATAIDGEQVTLSVDTWYVGGESSTVELQAPSGLTSLTGGIDFVEGERYLISATNGTVNYCGFSGPATPDLQAMYDEAFPG